jgi:hypothetical protein
LPFKGCVATAKPFEAPILHAVGGAGTHVHGNPVAGVGHQTIHP